jgi:hypothetical protein
LCFAKLKTDVAIGMIKAAIFTLRDTLFISFFLSLGASRINICFIRALFANGNKVRNLLYHKSSFFYLFTNRWWSNTFPRPLRIFN